jgi:ADP-ribose pyrophosphatase
MTASDLPEVIRSELIHRTPVFDVIGARLRFPDGREVDRAVVEHPGAVAIVALDAQGRWLLVTQYRHPARQRLLEIPAGTLEPGEAPDATAHRELREEIGCAAGALERLGGAWMAPGFTSEYIHYYLATDLRHDPLDGDEDEDLSEPIPMTLDELLGAIDRGEIEDAKTLVAVTLFQRRVRK